MEQRVEDLITGSVAGLSEIYGQALTEGLIPQSMSLEEFLELTRPNREKMTRGVHGSPDLLKELRRSGSNVAKLFHR